MAHAVILKLSVSSNTKYILKIPKTCDFQYSIYIIMYSLPTDVNSPSLWRRRINVCEQAILCKILRPMYLCGLFDRSPKLCTHTVLTSILPTILLTVTALSLCCIGCEIFILIIYYVRCVHWPDNDNHRQEDFTGYQLMLVIVQSLQLPWSNTHSCAKKLILYLLTLVFINVWYQAQSINTNETV